MRDEMLDRREAIREFVKTPSRSDLSEEVNELSSNRDRLNLTFVTTN